jgi:hypothetical protein
VGVVLLSAILVAAWAHLRVSASHVVRESTIRLDSPVPWGFLPAPWLWFFTATFAGALGGFFLVSYSRVRRRFGSRLALAVVVAGATFAASGHALGLWPAAIH